MREILFRGKRLNNGEWVEGSLIDGIYGAMPVIVTLPSVDDDFKLDFEYDHVDPATVGQYTGLKDKNGKRVFEGDVIKRFWLGAEIIYCVQYDGENAHFIGKAMNKSGFTTFDGDGEMFEVIGNITDNPELLEK